MEHAVQTIGLTKRFGRKAAVSSLDLVVPEGGFYLLIGPNGAGKTTTLRMLLGIVTPDSGSCRIAGAAPGASARARIGYVPETREMHYDWMRTGDLIAHHAGYYSTWDPGYARRLMTVFDVDPREKYGTLSKGQARRVQLLLALAHRPPLLLLDEPTDGLDPVARESVQTVLSEHIAESPTTVLVSTHLVYEMERFADHVGVMTAGGLVKQVGRAELHERLKRYVLAVPDGWDPAGLERELPLLRSNGSPRERRWTIWGDEREVTRRITAAGATVRSVAALTLEEAALALLTAKEQD